MGAGGARLPGVMVSLARERSDRAGGGSGREAVSPSHGRDFFSSKIRVSKLHFRAFKYDFSIMGIKRSQNSRRRTMNR